LFIIKLGYGFLAGPEIGSGFALGFGYRYELDEIALDISFGSIVWNNSSNFFEGDFGGDFEAVKLGGLYFLSPTSNNSFYLGGGLSYGVTLFSENNDSDANWGLRGNLSTGFEFMRASNMRFFIQADAILPFYKANYDSSDKYIPTFAISVGAGF